MHEVRQLRVYMIGVGISACVCRIALFLWTYYQIGDFLCRDGVSRLLSCLR